MLTNIEIIIKVMLYLPLLFSSPLFATDLIYLSNRLGEIDPCGCQDGPKGGLERLATFLQTLPSTALKIDGGESLFSSSVLSASRAEAEKQKAILLLESLRDMKFDLFAPGSADFAAGVEFLNRYGKGIKLLATDLIGASPNFLKEVILSQRNHRIGFFSLSDPQKLPQTLRMFWQPAEPILSNAPARLRAQGAETVVLISHLGLTKDLEISERYSGIDIVIGSASLEGLESPRQVSKVLITQLEPFNKYVGVFSRSDSKWVHSLVLLDEKYNQKNSYSAKIEKLKKLRVQSKNLQVPKRKSEAPGYRANTAYCRKCHPKQVEFWEGTSHASAYLVLFSKNQHYDPDCIGCHSLGFQMKGGFDKINEPFSFDDEKEDKSLFLDRFFKKVFEVEGDEIKPLDSRKEPVRYQKLHASYLKNLHKLYQETKLTKWYVGVQCEHCHGTRMNHPSEKTEKHPVSTQTCVQCHRPPNAPQFDPAWIKKIACPPINP